jgi:hypothetical protein
MLITIVLYVLGFNFAGEGLDAAVAGRRIGYVGVSTPDQNEKRQRDGQVLGEASSIAVVGILVSCLAPGWAVLG